MGKFSRLGNELYQGRKSFDFVGHRALWYAISGSLVAVAIAIILIKGLNFGIEFTGGTQYRVDNLSSSEASQSTADELRDAIGDSSVGSEAAPNVTTSGESSIIVQTEDLDTAGDKEIRSIIIDVTGASNEDISQDKIGASWGQEVAKRAIIGVGVFLILVMLFIWAYFREWKMSVAALVALIHDIALTIGVYALSGFPVTPAAVTGLLAILGFSMYDTVVVFDKIRENTHELKSGRQTYAQAANLAVNQTLVRSINTSIVALIPIGAILYVSAVQLGASSLKDLALAQFVGMAAGVFSSVYIAPRVLVHLKSTETEVKNADKRARTRVRHEADRYAMVPAFTDDLPVQNDPDDPDDEFDDGPVSSPPREPRPPAASNRGRIAPAARGPVKQSNAAGRVQPTRQPKSKRDKK
ncbi:MULTISPECIES: protein translocase subunit SecF [unclassified Nocardioides]|uniref:protein translocase subunit SecF n=1 Tax=unclassified Nocardioides TaxID=2615069 RepID=UPI0009F0F67C|nr:MULTISPECIES: protein translocase subunit SecF [unclassified Nocardioides]GAW49453.1 Protein-export membrane protein SecF [Nocardioides sp. PD653-B2]GAW55033.1 Protein-export membrane protein SecF [Nocardioides sp. PD653]